ncbi:MAG: MarC family protein [Methanoculleaceae archaeon]
MIDSSLLSFVLVTLSSIIIIINPLASALLFVSLSETLDPAQKKAAARDAVWTAFFVLLVFTVAGGYVLLLFGITIDAFRIAGGILLFGIGMEMVYARPSRTRITATEKYEGLDAEDIATVPLAVPMLAGPGAITTVIVLGDQAPASLYPLAKPLIITAVAVTLAATYYMMINADTLLRRIRQREYRAINRLMGILLLAIAAQIVITGIRGTFPALAG